MIVLFRRLLTGLLAFAAMGAWASVTELQLSRADARVNLLEHMSSLRLDAGINADPDQLWEGALGVAVAPGPRWRLDIGERMVGRITLRGGRERDVYVVEVPASSVDEVQVWYREDGGAWQSAMAGDRIALSRWPFAAQLPGFPVLLREAPVDLIVTAANTGPLRVVVSIVPDAVFREGATRSANLSGVIMGLGAMVSVVCLLGALTLRRRANWLLAGVSVWTLLTTACLNGYMAVWITPEMPAFNDACKHFAGVMLAGLMVALTGEALDPRYLRRAERTFSRLVPVVCLALAIAQLFWLPPSWRVPGAFLSALLTIACCVALCAASAWRGGRQVVLVSAAVACLTGAWTLALLPRDFAAGLDLRAAFVGVQLYGALLLFRQSMISRDRYGRDVLGRAAVSANRDPLTALLSYPGFELAYEEAMLRQGLGAQASSMMLFLLPGLEKSGAEHGYVVTERALVRFAAALQAALGNAWSIARPSKTRFACISTMPYDKEQVNTQATQVLARCARISHPLAPLADFDLRIACLHRPLEHDQLKLVLLELEQVALAMESGKRIVFV